MAGSSQTGTEVPPWGELRKLALEAVTADIGTILRNGTGRCLTPRDPVAVPRAGEPLTITFRSRPSVFLRDQLFFIADADLKKPTPADRHPASYRRYAANQLQLELSDETRAALGQVHSVRVFYVDDIKLQLKRALQDLLGEAAAGDLVTQLWGVSSRALLDPLPERSTAFPLHPSQEAALAAMTSPGGWFVWGPPGTGKTTVITEAVRRMLADDCSVLIASHTHVAVDNVLEGVADPTTGVDFECGEVIRVASSRTEDRVSAAVREHEHLLVGKAAAVLNRTVERREELRERIEANETHEARLRRDALDETLLEADAGAIERARRAVAAQDDLGQLEQQRSSIDARLADLDAEIDGRSRAAADVDVSEPERAAAGQRLRRREAEYAEAERGRDAAAQALAGAEAERDAIASRLALAQESLRGRAARVLPPVRVQRARRAVALTNEHAEAGQAIEQLEVLHQQAVRHAERARAGAQAAHAMQEALEARAERAARERAQAQRLSRQHDELARERQDLDEEIEQTAGLAQSVPTEQARAVLEEALRKGWLEALETLTAVTEVVDRLDEERRQMERERQAIEIDEAETRARLLREARLVGCTLSAYSLDSQLRERYFDVVILDEASSIEAPAVVLAGSRAERTFAVVGDFLQNAPIAETDDDPAAPEPHPWQDADIFALAGIRDHRSAQAHSRCVALRSQHRFPRIVADVVNDFCYGGLLETATRPDAEDAGAIIIMIDTSGHFEQQLTPDAGSWWSRLGLDLLRAIVQRPDLCAGVSLGFITPYRAQAERARRLRLQIENGVSIECGTAHAFQGRQYDTVVVDLMQDNRTRWVGKANLHGTRHAVAAAKLLNVALTRAKRRLYLIGDWDYVCRSSAPGMRALAELEGRHGFVTIEATKLL
jgi:broad-specificity NMP kinase